MDKNIKILLADDSAFMRKILTEILEKAGFSNFVECGDGKECLEKCEAEKPDLLLLDMIMPEIDGMEVLKQMKTKGLIIKTLVISAVGQEKMIEEARKLGVAGYIVKPFEGERVIEEITKILK